MLTVVPQSEEIMVVNGSGDDLQIVKTNFRLYGPN